jgi:hypothetical protein
MSLASIRGHNNTPRKRRKFYGVARRSEAKAEIEVGYKTAF